MSYTQQSTFGQTAVRERSIFKNVYMWMTAGLALTGLVAWYVGHNVQILNTLLSNRMLFFGLIIGELIMVMTLARRITTMSVNKATVLFGAYAMLNGVTLSPLLLVYTGQDISLAFFTTAATFAGVSLWAMTTDKDLSGFRHYLIMGVWGLIIASLINYFVQSPMMYYLISYIGVAVFIGLTAYDTQQIQKWNNQLGENADEAMVTRLSILGALKLYLDFINIFLFMLRIFGRRR
ncbi:MAG: Bax inhibitor-1/YccA family protein [Spirochaetaceae bacterium]|nr:Bax inhibitor-1/YccA family protein [Spirochaetaceae bacterium]